MINVLTDIIHDWETPTGGYLLIACFAGWRVAGTGVLSRLHELK